MVAFGLLGACAQQPPTTWPEPTPQQVRLGNEREELRERLRNERDQSARVASERLVRSLVQQPAGERLRVQPGGEIVVIGAERPGQGQSNYPGLWQPPPLGSAGRDASAAAIAAGNNARASNGVGAITGR